MGRACSSYGERGCTYGVLVSKPERSGRLEDPGVDGRIILKRIFEKLDGDMGWIDLAEDGERWRAVVNAAMNLRVP
jgi:hypothetical protein